MNSTDFVCMEPHKLLFASLFLLKEELQALPKLLMSQYEVEKPPQFGSKKKK